MSKSGILRPVGRTVDGKVVVAGVFRFYETEGLPLDILFEALQARGLLPDWTSFFQEAQAAGMSSERIFSKIDPALVDVFGSEFRDIVLGKLRAL